MASRRVGLWLIGAFGGVGSTVALGLACLARKLSPPTGLVTALPVCDGLDLDGPADFVVGGHDIRQSDFRESVLGLNERSGVFTARQIEACSPELLAWSGNVRPGTVIQSNDTIRALADLPDVQKVRSPREAIDRVQADLRAFQAKHKLDQVVVVNVASTEPPFELADEHRRLETLEAALDRATPPALPASSLYAYAALDAGLPYVNFTPSLGTSCPAARRTGPPAGVPHGGQDGKTGETLLKTVLAPMFAARHLDVLSWVGHNILGGGDGRTLNDPDNKASKVRSKDAALAAILGYKPQTHVSIEYVESLDDWKTAWDHVHFAGFLGTKMALQFTWQGCDSVLAAPLVIDLARLALLAQRRGERGVMAHLACFFKSPMGTDEHDFFRQWAAFAAVCRRPVSAESAFHRHLIAGPGTFAAMRRLADPAAVARPLFGADEPSGFGPDSEAARRREERLKTVSVAGRSRPSCPRAGGWTPTRSGCRCRGTTRRWNPTHRLVLDGNPVPRRARRPWLSQQVPEFEGDGVAMFDGER